MLPTRLRCARGLGTLLPGVLLLLGCTDPNIGVVRGTITVDGQPPANGTGSIAFFPLDGKSRTTGAEIIDGAYTARVPIGTVKVEIRVSKKVGEKRLYDTPDSPVAPVFVEALPGKYNDSSELRLDVQPGRNEQDYQLESRDEK